MNKLKKNLSCYVIYMLTKRAYLRLKFLLMKFIFDLYTYKKRSKVTNFFLGQKKIKSLILLKLIY